MKRTLFFVTLFISFLLSVAAIKSDVQQKIAFEWKTIQPIPDKHGFAGSFAGVSNQVLLVAGGANFPDGGAPWTGSVKVWHDTIFALSAIDGSWKVAGRLPSPLGYGVSVTWKNSLLCFGGSNAQGHQAKAFAVAYSNGSINVSSLPVLPSPIANTCGALVGDVVYIAGGIETTDAKTAGKNFWCLDLSKLNLQWQQLEPWPGEGRMLSVAGSQDGCFYVMGGTALVDGQRKYLHDAFSYHPKKGWRRIADLPFDVAAAPSPAYNGEKNQLIIFGGDDGKLAPMASSLKEKHPGFSSKIISYDTKKDLWSVIDDIATKKNADAATNPNGSIWAPVTTPFVQWNNRLVFPGGEVRPAVRTPNVVVATIKK